MSDDYEYVRARIPNYRGYTDEAARHDSDMRVRAILGESLSDAFVRFGAALDAAQNASYESLLLQCMFTDQTFVRRFEHAKLDEALEAALIAGDRHLVELEEAVNAVTEPAEFISLIGKIHTSLEHRREPLSPTP